MLNTGNLSVMSDGLRNAAMALDNFTADCNMYNSPDNTFQKNIDFNNENNDLVFYWCDNGVQQSLSMRQIHDFINGDTMLQLSQLLETVANLEEKIEAMEYYNDEQENAA